MYAVSFPENKDNYISIRMLDSKDWYKVTEEGRQYYVILVENKLMIIPKKCVRTISDEEYMVEEL